MEYIAIAFGLIGVYLLGFALGIHAQSKKTMEILEFAKKMNNEWKDHCQKIIDSYEEKLKVYEKEGDNNA